MLNLQNDSTHNHHNPMLKVDMNQRTKRLIMQAAAALLVGLTPITASAVGKGTKSVGLRAGYNTSNESALAGLYFQYRFTEHFRLSPNIDYLFRHNDTDALTFNINAHFPFDFSSSCCAVYPLAGLSYTSWSTRYNDQERIRRTSRSNSFGFNVGAGVEMYVTSSLKLMAEGKYCLVKHHHGGVFSVGIGYVF